MDARKFIDEKLSGAKVGGQRSGTRTSGDAAARRTAAATTKAADRRSATMVITRRLGERLNQLEERGVNVDRARSALSRAALATDRRRLETARALNKEVRDFVARSERGQRGSTGVGRQLADPIDAKFTAQQRRYSLDQQIRSLEAAGVRTDRLRNQLGEISTAQAQRRFGLAKQLGNQLGFDLRKERDKLKVQRQQTAETLRIGRLNVSPVTGRTPAGLIPGSPAARAAERAAQARQRREQLAADEQRRQAFGGRLNSALIGGAFPLLFGQGGGASVGGLLGGLAGGSKLGFGLSLVGTLIGQQFDVIAEKSVALGQALSNPIKNFDTLVNNALLSSKQLEKYAESLISTGREAEARALIELDLLAAYGDGKVFTDLAATQDELQRTVASLTTNIGTLVAGPLTDFLKIVNRTFDTGKRVDADGLPSPLSDEQLNEQRRRSSAFTNAGIAIGGVSPAGLAFNPKVALASLGLGAALIGIGQALAPQEESVEDFLARLQKTTDKQKEINSIQQKREDLIRAQITLIDDADGKLDASGRRDLRLAEARLQAELAISAAKGDAPRVDAAQLERTKAEAAINASFRKEQLQAERSEVSRLRAIEQAQATLGRAQTELRTTPLFDATQSQNLVRQLTRDISTAFADIANAESEVRAAQQSLSSARRLGGIEDIQKAATELTVASTNLETAGVNFRTVLQNGGNSLLENARSAATVLRDAVRSFRDLQQGNLRFLDPITRERQIDDIKRQALPESRRRGVALRGIDDAIAFNRFVEQETAARQDLGDANRNMITANESLRGSLIEQTGATNTLIGALNKLVDKSWAVYVEVPGQNTARAINLQAQLN
jgi:hypothetical protein